MKNLKSLIFTCIALPLLFWSCNSGQTESISEYVPDDKELYERVYVKSNMGKDPVKPFWSNEIGLKYKMSNFQAALGIGQLKRVEEIMEGVMKNLYINTSALVKLQNL